MVVTIVTACLWRGIYTIRCRVPEIFSRSRRLFVLLSAVSTWKHTGSGWHLLFTTILCYAMLCCVPILITFQFVINYYKLERICNTIASQFVINYYKLERICSVIASQIVTNYYKLARICNVFAFQFVIKYYILDDPQSTLENKG